MLAALQESSTQSFPEKCSTQAMLYGTNHQMDQLTYLTIRVKVHLEKTTSDGLSLLAES